jgi:hypothetical protein
MCNVNFLFKGATLDDSIFGESPVPRSLQTKPSQTAMPKHTHSVLTRTNSFSNTNSSVANTSSTHHGGINNKRTKDKDTYSVNSDLLSPSEVREYSRLHGITSYFPRRMKWHCH